MNSIIKVTLVLKDFTGISSSVWVKLPDVVTNPAHNVNVIKLQANTVI